MGACCCQSSGGGGTDPDELGKASGALPHIFGRLQTKHPGSGGSPINQITGELAIESETTFYWKTDPPLSQVIVADGEVLWVFDEDLFQVQVRPLDDALAASPAAILGGDLDVLGSRFRVTEDRSGTTAVYRLEPSATDEVTRRIVLRFDGSRLLDLAIDDALGNRSLVTLTAVTQGTPPSRTV